MFSLSFLRRVIYPVIPLLLLVSCDNNDRAAPVPGPATPSTFVLKRDTLQTHISLPGELSGFREVEIYARVNSYVRHLYADIGTEVMQGQLLIDLEAPEIQAQLTAARSRLASQEALYSASNSHYLRLLETSKTEGTISGNDLDQALGKRNADLAQLEAARAVQKEMTTMLDYLKVRAPFSGRVTARNVNVGAYVGANTAVPMLHIADYRKLRLTTYIPESYTGVLREGAELQFRIMSVKGSLFTARISRRAGALDKGMRTEQIEFDVDNPDGTLLPGMIAEVILPLNSRNRPFIVEKDAVVATGESVFVIRVKNNLAERIVVEKGLQTTDKAEIFSEELHEEDVLLLKADAAIRTGDRVLN